MRLGIQTTCSYPHDLNQWTCHTFKGGNFDAKELNKNCQARRGQSLPWEGNPCLGSCLLVYCQKASSQQISYNVSLSIHTQKTVHDISWHHFFLRVNEFHVVLHMSLSQRTMKEIIKLYFFYKICNSQEFKGWLSWLSFNSIPSLPNAFSAMLELKELKVMSSRRGKVPEEKTSPRSHKKIFLPANSPTSRGKYIFPANF